MSSREFLESLPYWIVFKTFNISRLYFNIVVKECYQIVVDCGFSIAFHSFEQLHVDACLTCNSIAWDLHEVLG